MNPLDHSGWLEIFTNSGRIDHFSEGIIRDVKLDIGKEQKSEHEMRESVANPYNPRRLYMWPPGIIPGSYVM